MESAKYYKYTKIYGKMDLIDLVEDLHATVRDLDFEVTRSGMTKDNVLCQLDEMMDQLLVLIRGFD